jgi:hypothetical protein
LFSTISIKNYEHLFSAKLPRKYLDLEKLKENKRHFTKVIPIDTDMQTECKINGTLDNDLERLEYGWDAGGAGRLGLHQRGHLHIHQLLNTQRFL